MLRIGLTGGIGAGKSTVSAVFEQCGGIIVDSDVLAREVVEPGTAGLAALVEAFGDEILLPGGALNRPALAAKVFGDDAQRARLNGIVHPLVARRRAEIIAGVPDDSVVVEDIPLLTETGMAPMFPLVVVVVADEELRVSRLVQRGMDEVDARARIAAQAPEEQRRAIADVLLDNSGSRDELAAAARDVWQHRVLPLADNIRRGRRVRIPPAVVPPDPRWPAQAQRIVNRIAMACGAGAGRVDHIGSTAVPGLDGKDVIDVQVTVVSLDAADELATALADIGYPREPDINADTAEADARSTVAEFDHTDDAALWRKRLHGAADPDRPAHIHLRVDGWPGQQFALLFRDWLVADARARQEYAAAKQPWFDEAYRRAWGWADATGWRP